MIKDLMLLTSNDGLIYFFRISAMSVMPLSIWCLPHISFLSTRYVLVHLLHVSSSSSLSLSLRNAGLYFYYISLNDNVILKS